MSIFLEISQLDNGDVVLREAEDEGDSPVVGDPIVSIRFSEEVRDMLGEELVSVAEAMIDAATDFLDNLDTPEDGSALTGSDDGSDDDAPLENPVIH